MFRATMKETKESRNSTVVWAFTFLALNCTPFCHEPWASPRNSSATWSTTSSTMKHWRSPYLFKGSRSKDKNVLDQKIVHVLIVYVQKCHSLCLKENKLKDPEAKFE